MVEKKKPKTPTDDDLHPELHAGDAERRITRGDRKLLNDSAAQGPLAHVAPPHSTWETRNLPRKEK